ncbi:MAG: hypothetical protein WC166_03600 [Bacteroidales bacterium]
MKIGSLCGGGNGILVGQKTQVKNHALLVYYIMRYVCDIYARDGWFGNSLCGGGNGGIAVNVVHVKNGCLAVIWYNRLAQ